MKSKLTIYNILPIILFSLIIMVSGYVLYEVKKNPSNQNVINLTGYSIDELIGKKRVVRRFPVPPKRWDLFDN